MEMAGRIRKFMKKMEADASMTVEAAVVIPVVLIALAICIRYTFILHDRYLGNAVLNEVMEQYGHRAEEDADPASDYAAEKLDHMLSQQRLDIMIEGDGSKSAGSVTAAGGTTEMEDRGFIPETIMRQMTLCDGLLSGKEQKSEDKNEEAR